MNARKIDRAQVTPNRAMAQWFEEDVLFQQMAQGDDIELLADFFELDALRRRGRESRRQRGWGHPYNGGSLRHHRGGRWQSAASGRATVHVSTKRPGPPTGMWMKRTGRLVAAERASLDDWIERTLASST